jgi:glycosyltransferase involved in cell wall biosynthesis
MISWEYPPKIVGGIARHVYDLSNALVAKGIEVHVLTCEYPGAPAEEVENGVVIHRVTPLWGGNDFVHWVQILNDALYARGAALIAELAAEDARLKRRVRTIIHAHDWLAHFSAHGLKTNFGFPVVATIHATEYGRNNGINTPLQQYISSVEWQLQYISWRVIVCSEFMKRECAHALNVPWEKMDVIYNGVDPTKFAARMNDHERAEVRARYALPHEKIIFFVGRMVREKGVQVLVEALPKIRWGYHDAKLLIVGGGYRDHLVAQSQYIGMEEFVCFTGFVPDEDLLKIFQVIDVACFPSLYEPFGIVALEAMAARVPVVVSDAGGLPEVVLGDITGTTTYAGNSNSLADGILKVLHDPGRARYLAEAAYQRVITIFNWDRIADETASVYDVILDAAMPDVDMLDCKPAQKAASSKKKKKAAAI